MSVRFKLDENISRNALELLAHAGHDAHSVVDEQLAGGRDERILEACQQEGRILVTLDLDFADIRLYPPSKHQGIWVLRPSTQSVRDTLSVLRGALSILGTEPTAKRL